MSPYEQANAIIEQSYTVRSEQGEEEATAFLTANSAILTAGAEAGNIEAMVELAELALFAGELEGVQAWIDRAEASARAGNVDDHLQLSNAYFRLRKGWGDVAEKERRSIRHLEAAAGLGEPSAQTALALHYLHGTAGCATDEALFRHWIGKAVAAGERFAMHLLAMHQFRAGEPVEPHVLEVLRAEGGGNRSVRALLRAQACRDRKASRRQ